MGKREKKMKMDKLSFWFGLILLIVGCVFVVWSKYALIGILPFAISGLSAIAVGGWLMWLSVRK
jgi:hypothetical protein